MEVAIRVDELHTALVRPPGFRYHEYRYCFCNNPEYQHVWGLNPTGKWFIQAQSLGMRKSIGSDSQEQIISSYVIDPKINALSKADNFCDVAPVPNLSSQRVILFTGAGSSVGVGYPTTSQVLSILPEGLLRLCYTILRSAPRLKHMALDLDIEILLDEVLRLQVLAY